MKNLIGIFLLIIFTSFTSVHGANAENSTTELSQYTKQGLVKQSETPEKPIIIEEEEEEEEPDC